MEAWLSELVAGRRSVGWDLFLDRYRRLILVTIKRLVRDDDDVMDLFATVCQSLSENDCARLKRLADSRAGEASLAPWVVAVVRNATIDWLRKETGRRRQVLPPDLSPLHQRIYRAVVLEGRSHTEAYELIRANTDPPLTFPLFLREVRETYRLAPHPSGKSSRPVFVGPPPDATAVPFDDPAAKTEMAERVSSALDSLPPDVRLAVELFVVERLSAADVARAVGWSNPKAVYNRVYRALEGMRDLLEREGIGPDDLP